jgi:hypothetical protein
MRELAEREATIPMVGFAYPGRLPDEAATQI